LGQLPQVSGQMHMPSPHVHLPQSCGQVLQSSFSQLSHMPLPQGHLPQSVGQLLQSSPSHASHIPLPQVLVPQPPHWFLHSLTQMLSHELLQQNGSMLQTQLSHLHLLQPGELLV
jgi:hypothetical protein